MRILAANHQATTQWLAGHNFTPSLEVRVLPHELSACYVPCLLVTLAHELQIPRRYTLYQLFSKGDSNGTYACKAHKILMIATLIIRTTSSLIMTITTRTRLREQELN
jgi:hypothetical protein